MDCEIWAVSGLPHPQAYPEVLQWMNSIRELFQADDWDVVVTWPTGGQA
jgi:adenine/guanine phosphoribosyltransferase-like PRPP-binding protein